MKKILLYKEGNVAVVDAKKSINDNANLKTSTAIQINKEGPTREVPATRKNAEKHLRRKGIKLDR